MIRVKRPAFISDPRREFCYYTYESRTNVTKQIPTSAFVYLVIEWTRLNKADNIGNIISELLRLCPSERLFFDTHSTSDKKELAFLQGLDVLDTFGLTGRSMEYTEEAISQISQLMGKLESRVIRAIVGGIDKDSLLKLDGECRSKGILGPYHAHIPVADFTFLFDEFNVAVIHCNKEEYWDRLIHFAHEVKWYTTKLGFEETM